MSHNSRAAVIAFSIAGALVISIVLILLATGKRSQNTSASGKERQNEKQKKQIANNDQIRPKNEPPTERDAEAEIAAVEWVKSLKGAVGRGGPEIQQQVIQIDIHSDYEIADADVKHIAAFKKLETLSIHSKSITNSGIIAIAKNSTIERLLVSAPKVNDDALRSVSAMPNLQLLSLMEMDITDAGLKHLEKCRSLQFLSLVKTKVTERGLAAFRKALPNCQIMEIEK